MSTATGREDEPDLDRLAERVDRALAAAETQEPAARERSREVRHAIEAFHKAGLIRIVRALKADPRGTELLLDLAADPTVYALFSMHGLMRADLRTRVVQALDLVRPYLQSHGGDVELVELTERTVTLRLTGACHGCSMSATTLRQGVEETLQTHVPEIETIIASSGEPAEAAAFVPLEALRAGGDAKGWLEGPAAGDVAEGRPYRFDTAEGSLVLLRFGEDLRAFRNTCAHQGLPLDGGIVDVASGTITCPWHGYRYDGLSGECLTTPQVRLEPFPLRIDGGTIYVRPE
ncbi:MAG TPA: NifU family protein [Thermoanaerobaculia bacterium]|nr:NifU family protein [Thermoanaerobaculia bacterium]